MTDPSGAPRSSSASRRIAGSSLSGAGWTTVSRLTGFGRAVTIAAVLGPSYFGNIFQATNLLPNLTYELLTGALFSSLLVPSLVKHIDAEDGRGAARVAGGFLGVALVAFSVVTVLVVAAGPFLLRVLSLGVEDAAVAEAQRRVGSVLIVLLMPQVLLYGVAATGAAVMNAHGRFALAAAAPAFENVGVIATMAVLVALFGTAPSLADVADPYLLVLGLGTTAAVGLHAGIQVWGARRCGVSLLPRAGWRDSEVRDVLRHAVPSLGYAGLNSVRVFVVLVVANRVPGGVVAFQLALNFFYLPVAVWARPVALAMLPQLSRLRAVPRRFHDELVRGISLATLLVVPAAMAYAVLAVPLARAASFGQMSTPAGVALVAASLAALAPGVLGEAGFVLATQASYARDDARAPFRSMVIRTAIALSGAVIAFLFARGLVLLVALGAAISVSNLVSAWHLGHPLLEDGADDSQRLRPALVRASVGSILMVIPAYVVATQLAGGSGGWRESLALVAAGLTGGSVFMLIQRLLRSPELDSLLHGRLSRTSAGGPS
ncbi:MAG TPA: lipid II flippase MurJ [Acidimicrobiales bacterium]|nr:lipid II flippase MurJ [Acidimicrobiales bacterium]